MAKLTSEDSEFVTAVQFIKGETRTIKGQTWQRFKLAVVSGTYSFTLGEGQKAQDSARHTGEEEADACLLCRAPKDEIAELAGQLQELAGGQRERVLFEPSEPTFELTASRSGPDGVKIEIWLDAGNAKTGIYRWDGVGVRFFTLQSNLARFVDELKSEFAC